MLITVGRYVIPRPGADTRGIPYPHMMVALNADVTLVEASGAYITRTDTVYGAFQDDCKVVV